MATAGNNQPTDAATTGVTAAIQADTSAIVSATGDNPVADTAVALQSYSPGAQQSGRVSSGTNTTTEIPAQTPHKSGGSAQTVGFIGAGLAIIALYLAYKLRNECAATFGRIKKLDDELRQRDELNTGLRKELEAVKTQLNATNTSLTALSATVAKLGQRQTSVVQPERPITTAANGTTSNGGATVHEVVPPPVKKSEVYYASPQIENGVARFWIRTMRKDASADKMFCLEVENETGTYTVNPAASDRITTDLQLFSKFVKPFSVPSVAGSRSVSVIKPGVISRQGQYWIITEKLEVTIQ